MLITQDDGKKKRVFTKVDTNGMDYERVVELYQGLQDLMIHTMEVQSNIKKKLKEKNKEIERLKLQLSKERKEIKEELKKERDMRRNSYEDRESRNKRLKEEFMKLL